MKKEIFMHSNLFVCCLYFFLFNSPLALSNDLQNLKSRLDLHNFESVFKDLKSLQCRQAFSFMTMVLSQLSSSDWEGGVIVIEKLLKDME